jgi:parallel beta-helix repeat protein
VPGSRLFESRHIRILHNSFRRNAGPGIHVVDSNRNLIKGNEFSRNHTALLVEGDRNRVRRNRFVRNDDEGILVTNNGNRNVIARNRIFRAKGSGVLIDKGRGNLVARNLVARARRSGIHLGIKSPLIGGANNTVRRNLVRGSGDDGFLVHKRDGHSLLRRNRARNNGGDGFDVKSRSAKLTGNSAVRNTDLGIQAVPGVSDGGGNVARHNGDRRRCTHIACE